MDGDGGREGEGSASTEQSKTEWRMGTEREQGDWQQKGGKQVSCEGGQGKYCEGGSVDGNETLGQLFRGLNFHLSRTRQGRQE